jgi:hypothetical protein
MKVCKSPQNASSIAVKISNSSIKSVNDLWSREKIYFEISPELQNMNADGLKEIVFRSVLYYLKCPGHVSLPGLIEPEEIEKEHGNHCLRVVKLWRYWHGSNTLDARVRRKASKVVS